MPITITEALAEIKTLSKRIATKRTTFSAYLARQEGVKDPLEKDGGSAQFITRERQSVSDLEERIVALRRGIAAANVQTVVTINGTSRPIADWLTWRREVWPGLRAFHDETRNSINRIRDQAKRQGATVVGTGTAPQKMEDIVMNVDEIALAKEREALEDTLGQLDGLLSLKNATVPIVE